MIVHKQTTQMLTWYKTNLPQSGDIIYYIWGNYSAIFLVLSFSEKKELITCLDTYGLVRNFVYELYKQ